MSPVNFFGNASLAWMGPLRPREVAKGSAEHPSSLLPSTPSSLSQIAHLLLDRAYVLGKSLCDLRRDCLYVFFFSLNFLCEVLHSNPELRTAFSNGPELCLQPPCIFRNCVPQMSLRSSGIPGAPGRGQYLSPPSVFEDHRRFALLCPSSMFGSMQRCISLLERRNLLANAPLPCQGGNGRSVSSTKTSEPSMYMQPSRVEE